MTVAPYIRHLDSITRSERSTLEAIRKPEDIKSARIIHTWYDDHVPCFGVELNGVEFGWWWSNYETIAAYMYWESSLPARVDLINHLLQELKDTPYEWKVGDEAWLEENDTFGTKCRVVITKIFPKGGTVHLIEAVTGVKRTNSLTNLTGSSTPIPPWNRRVVKIGKDGRCQCTCADPCPLGKTGSTMRCTEQELKAQGVTTVRP